MRFLFVDVETTGLVFEKDTITEIGLVLVDMKTNTILVNSSNLIKQTSQPELTDQISKMTGISQDMIDEFGIDLTEGLSNFTKLAEKADAIVAHNAPFDKKMIAAGFKSLGATPSEYVWIDTFTDIQYNSDVTGRKLKHLAADHNFLIPFAHRALFDALSTFKIVSNYDYTEIFKTAASAKVTLHCKITPPWEDNKEDPDKDRVKRLGFRWNPNKSLWDKTIKEQDLASEIEKASELQLIAEVSQ